MTSVVADIGEVAGILRGLRGETFRVAVHPLGDMGGASIASFSGQLDAVDEEHEPLRDLIHLRFDDHRPGPTITIEPDRFVKANVASSEEWLDPPRAWATDGDHGVLIYIRTVDAVVELTAYV